MTDQEIIDLFFARDEAAIVESERQYGRYCTSVAINILGSAADAEECVNDTWVRAWNAIPPNRPTSLKLFFTHIVRNLAISRYRARKAKRRGGELSLSLEELESCVPAREDSDRDLGEAINDFVGGLEPLDRKLFVGRYWYAYSLTTLSRAYGMSENAIAQRLYRIRERLRRHLTKGGYTV